MATSHLADAIVRLVSADEARFGGAYNEALPPDFNRGDNGVSNNRKIETESDKAAPSNKEDIATGDSDTGASSSAVDTEGTDKLTKPSVRTTLSQSRIVAGKKKRETIASLLQASKPNSKSVMQLVYSILNNEWANAQTRMVIVEYIIQVSKGKLPVFFSANFNGDFAMYYKEDHVVFFLELLVRLECGEVLARNKLNFLNWLDSPSVRMRILSFSSLVRLAETEPSVLYSLDGLLESIESKFCAMITNAPLVGSEKQSGSSLGGFFGRLGYGILSSSVGPSLLEPSGDPAREFFTVLNTVPSLNHDYQAAHVAHINLISMVHSWFMALYYPNNDNAMNDKHLPLVLGKELEETIVRYCVRLLDQVAMPKPAAYASGTGLLDPRLQDDLHESVTVEALRLLDLLCQQNSSLVTRLFPIVKRFAIDKFNAHIKRTESRHGPVVFLTAIQFFVNHNEVTTMFDVEPVFRSFFHDYLRRHYRNSLLAFETIRFCIFNKRKLLTHTSMLFLYFPAILKLIAWHPHSFKNELIELLPALISPPSCMELFHSILDLPLLASIMESSAENPRALMRSHSVNFDTTGPLKHRAPNTPLGSGQSVDEPDGNGGDNSYRSGAAGSEARLSQLIDYMLRDESASYGSSGPQKLSRKGAFDSLNGMDGCIWSVPGMRATVQKLCHSSNVTVRVHEVCLLVPALLNTYFDVMLVDAPQECVCAMLTIIYERFGVLFGPKLFQGRVRRVLMDRLLASFAKFPNFLMPMKKNIGKVVSAAQTEGDNAELALHSCWIVGEYAHVNKNQPAMISDFFQAIETIVYERLFVSTMSTQVGHSNRSKNLSGHYFESQASWSRSNDDARSKLYGIRIMHVLISTLTKLGACSSDLAPRAQLCLAKIISSHDKFHESVISRAKESVRLLKLSSVASNVFGLGSASGNNRNNIDELTSSLTFLLQPSATFLPGNKLHDFSL